MNIQRTCLFLCLLMQVACGEIITYKTDMKYWPVDSAFIGASLFVMDSSKDVIVRYKNNGDNALRYRISVIKPDGSEKILFNTLIKGIIEDSLNNIGKFQVGSELLIHVESVDPYLYSNIYTGQNRKGIDEFISNIDNGRKGAKWTAVARVDTTNVVIGISTVLSSFGFFDKFLYVSNVFLEAVEKNKAMRPLISQTDTIFSDSINLKLFVKQDGIRNVVRTEGTVSDSSVVIKIIDPIANGANVKIYYSLDKNETKQSFRVYDSSGIKLTSSATIRAFTRIDGDTNWFDSEIAEYSFVKNTSVAIINRVQKEEHSNINSSKANFLYSLNGRRVPVSNLPYKGINRYYTTETSSLVPVTQLVK